MSNPAYFAKYSCIRFDRDADGVLVMALHTNGCPLTFTAEVHEMLVDAFYDVGRDRANKVVILTGTGGDFIPAIDIGSFGDGSDPYVFSKLHDDGIQILENIANIRVPMIFALEGRAHVHADYGLLANVIVAGESASFNDLPHFADGIVPGDGVYTLWSHFVGPGRAQAMLLNPKPLSASEAFTLGVVAEVVPDGEALTRAKTIAKSYLTRNEITRRNTRIHFIQPIKERIIKEVGYGMALEGASIAALVKSMKTMSQ